MNKHKPENPKPPAMPQPETRRNVDTPVIWLCPKEFADRFGKTRGTIYRWIGEGLIPERFLHYRGKRELEISAEAIPHLQAHFRGLHDGT